MGEGAHALCGRVGHDLWYDASIRDHLESVDPPLPLNFTAVSRLIHSWTLQPFQGGSTPGLYSRFKVDPPLDFTAVSSLVKFRSLRSKQNIIIGCLASVDLLTGAAVQTTTIAFNLKHYFASVQIRCIPLPLRIIINRAFVVCSLYHVTLLNIDRYIAIKNTFHYPVIVTNQRITIAVVWAWVITIVLCITEYFVPSLSFLLTVFSILCIIICFYSFSVVILESRRHQNAIAAQHRSTGLPAFQRSASSTVFIFFTALFVLTYIFMGLKVKAVMISVDEVQPEKEQLEEDEGEISNWQLPFVFHEKDTNR
ncbi:predicted protein [Nematostella vectensis]|uniref:G-protein coupled receptors family 1 profile domain-containing protein n=1 Tax=Nematostella vectensis TaxID=45351 RepID=A7RKM1_NEMVE|nr:predicted protein [Nematostella vectensis]|eukprot:XP_001640074.1 predicted protein [Nematostella vectensis]